MSVNRIETSVDQGWSEYAVRYDDGFSIDMSTKFVRQLGHTLCLIVDAAVADASGAIGYTRAVEKYRNAPDQENTVPPERTGDVIDHLEVPLLTRRSPMVLRKENRSIC